MGIIIPTYKELERQWASEEEGEIHDLRDWRDDYMEYLEDQKELLAQILLSGNPLSELDRTEIAHLLCPDLYAKEVKSPGRPKGTDRTFRRDFKIALEYEELYSKGGSESAFEILRDKYGFRDCSSIKKSLSRVKKIRTEYGYKPQRKS